MQDYAYIGVANNLRVDHPTVCKTNFNAFSFEVNTPGSIVLLSRTDLSFENEANTALLSNKS